MTIQQWQYAALFGAQRAVSFGQGASGDPSLPSSYPGLVSSTTGIIYPQTGITSVASITGGATDPVYEYRGATADAYGGGMWLFPSATNLAPSPFVYTAGAGWTLQGTQTVTASGVTAPDGITNANKLNQTTVNYADIHVSYGGGSPVTFSVWYQDPATSAPGRPTWPNFVRGGFTPANVASNFPASVGWSRFSYMQGTGAGTTAIGLTPAGSSSTGAAVNTGPAAGLIIWGLQAVSGIYDLPLLSGTASAAKTIDARRSALLIDKLGNLDFIVTFLPSTAPGNEIGSRVYLWSATTPDGLVALSYTAGTGGYNFVLTVRGSDVLFSSAINASSTGMTTCASPGEPMTVRAWYNVSGGVSGIRVSVAGLYVPDYRGTTTGTALAGTAAVYLGTNLGSATGAFRGRMKPYRRPTPSVGAPAPVRVEAVIVGDSILAPFGALDSVGSYIYSQGASGEWATRAGIGDIARPIYTIVAQTAYWANVGGATVNQWQHGSYVNAALIQCGINDIITGSDRATIRTNLQLLINQIKSDIPTIKIVLNTLLPARGYSGMTAGMYVIWQNINADIRGGFFTNVDRINDVAAMSSPWNDGADNLAALVDNGDHLHTNNLGRYKQAQDPTYGWRPILTSMGLLP